MNRCRTILAGALIAVPMATIGVSAEAAFAADPCGAVTDEPQCREGGMGFGLGGDTPGNRPPDFRNGNGAVNCPVVPYTNPPAFDCQFANLSSETAAIDAVTRELPRAAEASDGNSATTAAAATAAALLVAVGAPLWIRRIRRNG